MEPSRLTITPQEEEEAREKEIKGNFVTQSEHAANSNDRTPAHYLWNKFLGVVSHMFPVDLVLYLDMVGM